MKQIQIEALRDFAIAFLPRAQSFMRQFSRFGGTEAELYGQLTAISVRLQGKPETPAIETAAARVLLTVALLRTKHEAPLTKTQRADLLSALTVEAHDLCGLTGKQVPWLDSAQAILPAENEKEEAPDHPPTQSIEGKLLTTDQVAEILGVKPTTLTDWARKQKGVILPTSKIGRQYRYSGDEVLALVQSSQIPKSKKSK